MKKFSKKTFVVSTIVLGLFLVPRFLAAFGEDDGTISEKTLWIVFARLFDVLRFPTHTLAWTIFSSTAIMYFIGLILNCMFWGLLIERISWLLKTKLT
jgi:hypothetical protein